MRQPSPSSVTTLATGGFRTSRRTGAAVVGTDDEIGGPSAFDPRAAGLHERVSAHEKHDRRSVARDMFGKVAASCWFEPAMLTGRTTQVAGAAALTASARTGDGQANSRRHVAGESPSGHIH